MIGPDRDGQRGAALLTVLIFSALLASLAAVAMRSATSGARAAAVFLDAMRADELARGIADAVAYQVVNGGPAWKRGGTFTVHLGQADLDVDYRSESARVDVNKAPVELIAAVLAAAGAEPSLIAAVTSRVAALRSNGATPPATTAAEADGFVSPLGGGATLTPAELAPKPPSTAPQIQRTLEVAQIWGLPDRLARRVLPALTVANGTRKIDPVLADGLVLSALMGGDEARVDDYVERRASGFVNSDSALVLLPTSSRSFAGFTDVSAVRAVARVTVAHRFVRRYEVVLNPSSFAGTAPDILSWQPLF